MVNLIAFHHCVFNKVEILICSISKYNNTVTGAISSANLGKPDGVLYSKTNGSFATFLKYPLPASIDESEPKNSPSTTLPLHLDRKLHSYYQLHLEGMHFQYLVHMHGRKKSKLLPSLNPYVTGAVGKP